MDDVERSDRAWNRRLDVLMVFAIVIEIVVAGVEAAEGAWVFVPMLVLCAITLGFTIWVRHRLPEWSQSSSTHVGRSCTSVDDV